MPDEPDLNAIFGPETATDQPAEATQTPPAAPPPPAGTSAPQGAPQQFDATADDFWATVDEPPDFQGNPFMSAEQKDQAIAEGWTLTATSCRNAMTQVGPTWFVDVILPSGELVTLTLKHGGGIFSRDHYFERMQAWFLRHPGGRLPFRLSRSGRTTTVEAAG